MFGTGHAAPTQGHRYQPLGKSIMTANLIEYVEGQGINTRAPVNKQIGNDLNARSPATYTTGKKTLQLQALENEIAQ